MQTKHPSAEDAQQVHKVETQQDPQGLQEDHSSYHTSYN